jgi:hypothetical protein
MNEKQMRERHTVSQQFKADLMKFGEEVNAALRHVQQIEKQDTVVLRRHLLGRLNWLLTGR